MKFKVRVELRSKETFTVRADSAKEAEEIAIDMSDGMNLEVYDVNVDQLEDDDAREVDNE